MKRAVSIILAIALFVVSGTAFAEHEAQPGTIRFMGMDWGITVDEFENVLNDKGIEYEYNWYATGESTLPFDRWLNFAWDTPYEPEYDGDLSAMKYYRSCYYPKSDDDRSLLPKRKYLTNVAGYNVSFISAVFLPSYSKETLQVGRPYRLASAKYSIGEDGTPDMVTIDEAYDDIKEKLISLYGNPCYESEDIGNKPEKCAFWIAEDGSGVIVRIFNLNSFLTREITIEYGIVDDSDYINNILSIYDEIKRQNLEENAGNADGL